MSNSVDLYSHKRLSCRDSEARIFCFSSAFGGEIFASEAPASGPAYFPVKNARYLNLKYKKFIFSINLACMFDIAFFQIGVID